MTMNDRRTIRPGVMPDLVTTASLSFEIDPSRRSLRVNSAYVTPEAAEQVRPLEDGPADTRRRLPAPSIQPALRGGREPRPRGSQALPRLSHLRYGNPECLGMKPGNRLQEGVRFQLTIRRICASSP